LYLVLLVEFVEEVDEGRGEEVEEDGMRARARELSVEGEDGDGDGDGEREDGDD
jgi:hypothetical protein